MKVDHIFICVNPPFPHYDRLNPTGSYYSVQVIITDAANWKVVERKARLAGNGLRPCQKAQQRWHSELIQGRVRIGQRITT